MGFTIMLLYAGPCKLQGRQYCRPQDSPKVKKSNYELTQTGFVQWKSIMGFTIMLLNARPCKTHGWCQGRPQDQKIIKLEQPMWFREYSSNLQIAFVFFCGGMCGN